MTDRRGLLIDLALMIGAFLAATLVAEAAGAANLGDRDHLRPDRLRAGRFYVLIKR